jgi:hypothetical protein
MKPYGPALGLIPVHRGQKIDSSLCQEVAYLFKLVHGNCLLFFVLIIPQKGYSAHTTFKII